MIPVIRPWLGEEEAEAAASAVRSGWVAQGPRVTEFEKAFSGYAGAAEGVAVSSCTTALHLALHLLGVEPGDEVVVPSFSFIATANAARYAGATPVFADVDPLTGNLTPATIEAVLTPRTVAVIGVHQGGVPFDVDALEAVCSKHSLALVHDSACAAGSTYRGKPVSASASLATWSFHPRKLLTTGEGGMLTVSDSDQAARLRRLREHGMSVSAADRHTSSGVKLESYEEVGFNYRMTDIQAAIGLVQLAKLPDVIERRRELAGRYHKLLAETDGLTWVTDPEYGTTNYQSFWVVLPDSYEGTSVDVLEGLLTRGVSARRGIMASHLEPAYSKVDLPVTEHLTSRSVILPLFHQMTESEQDTVVAALAETIR
ncbi:DegT/DnrJ/EryC1/StrS family aminotransferase [Kibdelosporangium phytohabitans]|uniref:Glutamine--scyllo-inositol aminotransferase n=1 Tax=Kibdelosporangium phytohabitans TaxID=860235 RepID=A0A0N9IDY4_9PSEU|nr:DegT/DnrJ/EryC1/StrS aminotransferase family protein [Kibdelosporangium phytohabitans]ALG14654.1 glutamine--scyllo-inositol aminotransferase [Kibdelosporangium phytohabitans]MBE1468370.1 perosamine synthetase [Kibdelosporangium phytohabitans]